MTVTQALTWITDPKPLSALNTYGGWDCKKSTPSASKPCNLSNKCALPFKRSTSNVTDTRYMETCRDCPKQYPWLGDAEGTGVAGRDNYNYGVQEEETGTEEEEEQRRKK